MFRKVPVPLDLFSGFWFCCFSECQGNPNPFRGTYHSTGKTLIRSHSNLDTHNKMQKLEKWLFPHLPRDLRQRQMRTLMLIMLTGFGVAGGIAVLLVRFSGNHH